MSGFEDFKQAVESSTGAVVGVVMGSDSDWAPAMQYTGAMLKKLHIPFEVFVVSAHRTPERVSYYAERARDRGIVAIIAGAGGSAHLAGALAAHTSVPILGVPVGNKNLGGQIALHSIVQMPSGRPVATFGIGKSGAENAVLFAAGIIAVHDEDVRRRLDKFRADQTDAVPISP